MKFTLAATLFTIAVMVSAAPLEPRADPLAGCNSMTFLREYKPVADANGLYICYDDASGQRMFSFKTGNDWHKLFAAHDHLEQAAGDLCEHIEDEAQRGACFSAIITACNNDIGFCGNLPEYGREY